MRKYVGQAKSEERYEKRKGEHEKKNGKKYDFKELGRAKPGVDLDVLEEDWIRAGGGPGELENKRHQMNPKRYEAGGGTCPLWSLIGRLVKSAVPFPGGVDDVGRLQEDR